MLLQIAVLTGVAGVVFLVSLLWRRPLFLYLSQAFFGGRHSVDGAAMEADYDRYTQARFAWRTTNTVWGVANLLLAVGLVVVVQNTSTATAMTVNNTAPLLTFAALSVWSYWWFGAPVRSKKQEASVLGLELELEPHPDSHNIPARPNGSHGQAKATEEQGDERAS